MDNLKNQPLFSYNDLEKRFNSMEHRIHIPLLVKSRYLEYFKNILKHK